MVWAVAGALKVTLVPAPPRKVLAVVVLRLPASVSLVPAVVRVSGVAPCRVTLLASALPEAITGATALLASVAGMTAEMAAVGTQ